MHSRRRYFSTDHLTANDNETTTTHPISTITTTATMTTTMTIPQVDWEEPWIRGIFALQALVLIVTVWKRSSASALISLGLFESTSVCGGIEGWRG